MLGSKIIGTLASKFTILFLSFGLIIFSTNIWGSEGKGIISLVIADLAIIGFISNIIVSNSISFLTSKFDIKSLLLPAYVWSIIIGITIPYILALFHPLEHQLYLTLISISLSLLTANISVFIGIEKIRLYNIYTLLQTAMLVIFVLFYIYLLSNKEVEIYFKAQIISFFTLFAISLYHLRSYLSKSKFSFSKLAFTQMFDYGWKTQLSAFIQFLNYRLSYFFILDIINISSLGVFSVGVAFSEAIWVISKSLSVILYSKVINDTDNSESIQYTKLSIKLSFLLTALLIGISLLIPASVYTSIFGEDFYEVKEIILYLSPGIIFIAVSNIIGHYFSGTNQLRILNIKSIIGLIITLSISMYFIKEQGIIGACISSSASYVASSMVLLIYFYRKVTFEFSDFIITKTEITKIRSLLKK